MSLGEGTRRDVERRSPVLEGKKSAPPCAATVFNCSIAAGRYTSVETARTFFLRSSFSQRASLPAAVVFPAPSRLAESLPAAGCQIQLLLLFVEVAADQRCQFTLHNSDERLAWRQTAADIFTQRLVLDAGDEVAHNRQRTSASNSATRTSRSIDCMFLSVRRAWPRIVLTTRASLVVS